MPLAYILLAILAVALIVASAAAYFARRNEDAALAKWANASDIATTAVQQRDRLGAEYAKLFAQTNTLRADCLTFGYGRIKDDCAFELIDPREPSPPPRPYFVNKPEPVA